MQDFKVKNDSLNANIAKPLHNLPVSQDCNYPDSDLFTVYPNHTVHIVRGDLFD